MTPVKTMLRKRMGKVSKCLFWLVLSGLASAARATAAPPSLLYQRLCLPCHGANGDGRGPAAPWLFPEPRSFQRGLYKWRSTPSGQLPTDADLVRTIREGASGTSMPAFAALSAADLVTLTRDVQRLTPRYFKTQAPPPVTLPPPPQETPELVARGRELVVKLGCPSCHGPELRGDGTAAPAKDARGRSLAPYDLRALPPRGGSDLRSLALHLDTGLDGTTMPSFRASSPQDLYAVAAYLRSLDGAGALASLQAATDSVTLSPTLTARAAPDMAAAAGEPGQGFHPGVTPAEAVLFATRVPPMGPRPPLAPAELSLSAQQCGRCHARQLRDWSASIHARGFDAGVAGQLMSNAPRFVERCQTCHAPLAEQLPLARGAPDVVPLNDQDAPPRNPDFDAGVRAEGVTCAACHLRRWAKYGPPARPSGLLSNPALAVTELPIYERADFCLPCHQQPASLALGGKPLLNTYLEWLASPYQARGYLCQNCHMPEREHTWKGAHDPETVRQGVRLDVTPEGPHGLRAAVTNVGCGHDFPTTATPAATLSVTLLSRGGKPVARRELRIARNAVFDGKAWVERPADTRIPPGRSAVLSATFTPAELGRSARRARVELRFAPDDYYTGFYRASLADEHRDPAARKLLEEALARTLASPFTVQTLEVAVP